MYNTYQNRVATAREVLSQAKLAYDNNIKEAMLQNNAALAEIYSNLYIKQAELALEGFQYKNQLVIDLANKKVEFENTKWNRYQDILQQINTQNALKEEVRQFETEMDWKTEQADLDRQHTLKRDELNRQFEAEQAELERKHDKEMESIKDKHAKEQLKIQHENEMAQLKKKQEYTMAQLDKQLANEKAVLKYKDELSKVAITGSSNTSSGKTGTTSKTKTTYNNNKTPVTKQSTKSVDSKATALDNEGQRLKAMQKATSKGVSKAMASSIYTFDEWSRRKASYSMSGQGGAAVKNYDTYQEYLQDYPDYLIKTYGKK